MSESSPEEPSPPRPRPPERAVTIAGVTVDLPNANPVLTLREIEHPWRELRLPIGMPEGASIAAALKGEQSLRPLTHDLFATVLDRYGIEIARVVLTRVLDGVYHAELVLRAGDDEHVLSCRPSDAVALALRRSRPVPVLVNDEVLDTATADRR